jgi:5-methylcytosine-specific restriction protein A
MEKNQDIKLTSFLRAKAAEAERAIRYRPNFFLGMLETNGGYLTVIKLLSANGVSDGFKKLWEHSRLDLSVEALIVESEWRSAFDSVLIARAEKRLNEVGYRFTRFATV